MASKEITLPSGATVVIRDPDDFTYGDRREILVKRSKADEEMKSLVTIEDIIALIVESWTCTDKDGHELMLPSVKVTVLQKLKNADMDVLIEEAGKVSAKLFGSGTAKTKENEENADSPLDK